MSQNLAISETGLKLIKAFEGYRPVDRELISGQRIVGYGHRLYSEDAVIMNKEEAETVLRSDLEPFEEMINTEVHAPITQSQFDALCSFAFNIGPRDFLKSDTLRALNNGRPLDAANGLDVWRKSKIAGKTYVVDALMRRRTAEKALFLRADRYLPAGREDLPPVKDTTIIGLSTEDALPVFTDDDANGLVSTVPYAAKNTPMRRREDGPAGALQLSELDIIEDADLDEVEAIVAEKTLSNPTADVQDIFETKEALLTEETVSLDKEKGLNSQDENLPISPIAAAASDIVARLDALIEDAGPELESRDEQWPDSLIKAELMPEKEIQASDKDTAEKMNVIDLNTREKLAVDVEAAITNDVTKDNLVEENERAEPGQPVVVIDELAQDDAFKARTDSASKYIETYTPVPSEPLSEKKAGAGLWIPVILGFTLLGAAAGAMGRGAEALLGEWGPIIAFIGIVIGISLILAAIYATLRISTRNL